MRGHGVDTIELPSSGWLVGCFSRGVEIRDGNRLLRSDVFETHPNLSDSP